MIELFREYWPVVLIAVAIGIIVGFLIFRPRQRVRLTDSSPLRPHMVSQPKETELEHEAAVATQHVLGAEGLKSSSDADDLERLKGVGPKLAAILVGRGITRYDQIARMTDSELQLLDEHLGAFRGRLQRDRVVEQAGYLASGDVDGFERRFGKLER